MGRVLIWMFSVWKICSSFCVVISWTVLNEESTPMPSNIHKLTSHFMNNRRSTRPEIDPVSLEVLLLPSG